MRKEDDLVKVLRVDHISSSDQRATTISYDSHELIDRAEEKLSNEEDAPMCLAVSPGDEDEEPALVTTAGGKEEEEETSSWGPSERKVRLNSFCWYVKEQSC